MGKSYMLRKEQISDLGVSKIPYVHINASAPTLSGTKLKAFVWALENRLTGPLILNYIKSQNSMTKILADTVIPDAPMFLPEMPSAEPQEQLVWKVSEDSSPASRLDIALKGLNHDGAQLQEKNESDQYPFLYWTIRDYAEAYRSHKVTPSQVAERFIKCVENSKKKLDSPLALFSSFDPADVRQQATASTKRFADGTPLSILDGVLVPVKDEIDCTPHLSNGGTTWFSKVRDTHNDAECIARLRECGVILAGKTNMNELGMGVTGTNAHYGCVRNPHDPSRYSGGSAAGSVAVVSCGLCPAAIATDGGGSVRIPSSLCGTVGFKTTFGRTTLEGVLPLGWTLEVVCPVGATVEDTLLVYAAMVGSLEKDVLYSRPPSPHLPVIACGDDGSGSFGSVIGALKLGKYTDLRKELKLDSQWFNDCAPEVSQVCGKALELLQSTFGTQTTEIVIPELQELQIGHLVTVGSEVATALSADYEHGRKKELSYETRSTMTLFRSLTNRDYIVAQSLRRRQMYHHLRVFEEVDVIVTPTTAVTAPSISPGALKGGESNLELTSSLLRYVPAANFVGLPAISVPVGHDSQGLPIGIQLIGRPWAEATLLQLASAIEKVCAPFRKRPIIFYDILSGVW